MSHPYQHLPDRALSIRQPWAWAIINAGKDIENRSWRTSFRGPVCIHAAQATPNDEFVAARDFISSLKIRQGYLRHPMPQWRTAIAKGGIIGTAEIVDCVEESASPWFMGPFGFVLANVEPVPFIYVKGALGFFDWRKR